LIDSETRAGVAGRPEPPPAATLPLTGSAAALTVLSGLAGLGAGVAVTILVRRRRIRYIA
jgi:LPXTG-motif cell wall-anchored protein